MIMITAILLATITSATLYRLGGSAKNGSWYDILKNTKTRDLGCPLIAMTIMSFYIFAPLWIHAVSFLLCFGALTTYWDRIFKHDNFYMHGLMIGLAYIPYVMCIHWYMIVFRAIIMAIFMGIWCELFKNDVVEETGRGSIIALTLPLLLL